MDALVALFGEEIRQLIGNPLIALTTAQIEGSITNTRLQQLIGDHASEISKLLKELCTIGYLTLSGKGRGTVYQLNTQYVSENQENISGIAIGVQGELFKDESAKMETSGVKMETSGAKMETSGAKMETSSVKMETSGVKMETSSKSLKKRMKPDELQQSVVAYCLDEYKSVDEISLHLHLTTKYLQNKVIPPLLVSGQLERLYPDSPNHPQQKYKVKK